jgi:glycerol-3-phosphate dehydrogenase
MPWELCIAAAENAAKNGADIILNTEVTGVAVAENGGGCVVNTNNGTFYARGIVNCAGMAADKVLEMSSEPIVHIVPSWGDYFVLDTKASGHIKHIIFHEPEEKGKGLTLVPTVDGNILVGPTERQAGETLVSNAAIIMQNAEMCANGNHPGASRHPSAGGELFETDHEGLDLLRALVSDVAPSLPIEHIIRSFGAVRPNPFLVNAEIITQNAEISANGNHPGDSRHPSAGWELHNKSVNDFCIIESNNAPIINLVGIKTPGLTCANELGIYVSYKLAARLGAAPNPEYDPHRAPPVLLSDMPFGEREAFLKKNNPCYGRIVCRCRGVSEGEIIDAIHRFPGAVTLDGVKRRTGAGFGRCQGSFCSQRVIEIIARELRRAPEEITKDGEGSWVFYGTL